MSTKNNVNNSIESEAIETKGQKVVRTAIDKILTVLIVILTIAFVVAVATFMHEMSSSSKYRTAPSGKDMLKRIEKYSLFAVTPFDIVEDSVHTRFYDGVEKDKYLDTAVAVGEYTDAALRRYAYEYAGDTQNADKFKAIMDDARSRMEYDVYADQIDENYKKLEVK